MKICSSHSLSGVREDKRKGDIRRKQSPFRGTLATKCLPTPRLLLRRDLAVDLRMASSTREDLVITTFGRAQVRAHDLRWRE